MKLVVFTDLDATLLDPDTYSWAAAKEALGALKERRAAIVLVSSKTFTEMESLHRELELDDPFIVENGGGMAFGRQMSTATQIAGLRHDGPPAPRGKLMVLPLGTGYAKLVSALAEIAREAGFPLRGFASMSDEEVASLTGLSLLDAAKARDREFDEPFVAPESARIQADSIRQAATRRGLTVVQGGRFWHLIGHGGKGRAVSLLIGIYRGLYSETVTVGLGDSPNDYPFLELVDVPVLVGGSASGTGRLHWASRARHTAQPGPKGWNIAILTLLAELDAQLLNVKDSGR
jgi:mannosyl-3-phosphoglycerate phosphatase